jgi:cold shock CspA family protein
MQATVRSFDPATGCGSVFTDDGSVWEFGAGAFARSGLRLLRPGQRVAVRTDGTAVTALALATLPLPPVGPAAGSPGHAPGTSRRPDADRPPGTGRP